MGRDKCRRGGCLGVERRRGRGWWSWGCKNYKYRVKGGAWNICQQITVSPLGILNFLSFLYHMRPNSLSSTCTGYWNDKGMHVTETILLRHNERLNCQAQVQKLSEAINKFVNVSSQLCVIYHENMHVCAHTHTHTHTHAKTFAGCLTNPHQKVIFLYLFALSVSPIFCLCLTLSHTDTHTHARARADTHTYIHIHTQTHTHIWTQTRQTHLPLACNLVVYNLHKCPIGHSYSLPLPHPQLPAGQIWKL